MRLLMVYAFPVVGLWVGLMYAAIAIKDSQLLFGCLGVLVLMLCSMFYSLAAVVDWVALRHLLLARKQASAQEELVCRELPAFRCSVPTDVSGDLCCICLEAKRDGQMLCKLGCGHDFHVDCVGYWVESRSTRSRVSCPMCRWVQPSTVSEPRGIGT